MADNWVGVLMAVTGFAVAFGMAKTIATVLKKHHQARAQSDTTSGETVRLSGYLIF